MPEVRGWSAAFLFGAIAGFSLFLGGALTFALRPSRRVMALAMAFGAGVLIASLSYGLMEEAYRHGGLDAGAIGLAGGAILYYVAHVVLLRHPKEQSTHLMLGTGKPRAGLAILTATVMDGLPEQFALGVGIKLGSRLGLLVMAAILLSNLSEAVVATPELARERGTARTLALWAFIGLLSTSATLLGYLVARRVSGDVIGFLLAFAGGAVLAMLADTLLPEALRRGGPLTSIATTAGFLLAFFLARR